MSKDIAIDLGSSNIRVYAPNKNILFSEPAVVTIDNYTGDILAYGEKAYKMEGKTSDRISVIYPLEKGVISEFDLAQQLVHKVMENVYLSKVVMPRVVVCIPGEMTEVEKKAVVNVVSMASVRKVCLIENPISSAIGAGIDVSLPAGNLVVDIGSGTTDVAVISLSGVSVIKSIKIGGKIIDENIVKYVHDKYNILIGRPTAETIKKLIGCAYPLDEELFYTVKGRNMVTGMPDKVEVSSTEIYTCCEEVVNQITTLICNVLEETPPELVGDIYASGIILTGGMAQLKGLDRAIGKATNLRIYVAEEPDLCAVKGAGHSTQFIDDMDDSGSKTLNPLDSNY